MDFLSDNTSGVCPEVLDAILAEADRTDGAYGTDAATSRLLHRLEEVFEHPVGVFPVATGTAANSLALAATNPVWGGVLCHPGSHVLADECAAPTVLGGGLSLIPVPSSGDRLDAPSIEGFLHRRRDAGVHTVPVTGMTVTQVTESGTRYKPAELGELAELAVGRGWRVHMDGARFANAVAAGGSSPAELTWKSGIGVMSLGATKGGAMGAEAVVVFDEDLLAETEALQRLRKRSGHLLSKQRFASAQIDAWLRDGAWLNHADHANFLAARLADGLSTLGIPIAHPVEANMVFALLTPRQDSAARAAGACYYRESPGGRFSGSDLVEARLVTSWATDPQEVEGLVKALGSA